MSAFQMSVCPHDTAKNLTGWFLLNTYLQGRLDCRIHFEPKQNFLQEREDVLQGDYHIVYANPMSAVIFRQKLGFIPVARPIELFDNAVLVGNSGTPQQAPVRVASATDQLIVHPLGLSLLLQRGIVLKDCQFQFTGSHLGALKAVIKGDADFGIIYDETWDELAATTRQGVQEIARTHSQASYHCFCVAPAWTERAEKVKNLLCGMQDTPEGKRILDDLRFKGFEPVNVADFDALAASLQSPEPCLAVA